MGREDNRQVDLLKINVEVGWNCNFNCEDCYRFFDCPSPLKFQIYSRGRMEKIEERLSRVGHIIAVLSGKGGVGKSTVSANLATTFAERGFSTGIIDSDFYGPSIPKILGIKNGKFRAGRRGAIPPSTPSGIRVASSAFLLGDQEALTWFSGLQREALEFFLAHVEYGDLDFLIIDLPPGTGSETVNLMKYITKLSGAVVITIPSQVSQGVVNRGITLCQKARIPIIGIIENMSSYICKNCGESFPLLQRGGGEILAEKREVPFLGRIPLDNKVAESGDEGKPFMLSSPDSLAGRSFRVISERIEKEIRVEGEERRSSGESKIEEENQENLPEIVKINLELGCYGKRCEDCGTYFECVYPHKKKIDNLSRMEKIRERMGEIKYKIAVMSGKGGVGKSTVSANLSFALARMGKSTGILDSDLHGPCIPKILGIKDKRLKMGDRGIQPARGQLDIRVISMAFMLEEGEAVTWFHNLKRGAVEEFLAHVAYGKLDYLIIDLPPGTGSESYSLLQSLPDLDGALIVTIPSQVSQTVAIRSINLCRRANVPIIGVIENMSGFICPDCGDKSDIFMAGGGEAIARKAKVPFLGSIPLDPRVSKCSDRGTSFLFNHPESPAAKSFLSMVKKIEGMVESGLSIRK